MTDGYQTYHVKFVMDTTVESLCCKPETNTVFYDNYTSIKKFLNAHLSALQPIPHIIVLLRHSTGDKKWCLLIVLLYIL